MKIQNVRNMLNSFSGLTSKMLFFNQSEIIENEEEELIYTIERAQQELNAAESFFNAATDPDLVDHAVFNLEAAEKKYFYLLKQARKRGYKAKFRKLTK